MIKEIVATQSPASNRPFLITLANICLSTPPPPPPPPPNTLFSLILQSESVMEFCIVGKEKF